jgi:hypothetical protein
VKWKWKDDGKKKNGGRAEIEELANRVEQE